jgi:hypothetical protein
MIELNTPVTVHVFDGRRTRPVGGVVVGRTREEAPRYDVSTEEGTFNNIPERDIDHQE